MKVGSSITKFTICRRFGRTPTVTFASCGESGDALVLAPTTRTWFDSSPPTKSNSFLFPSNRSESGSVLPPNGSTSPADGNIRTSEVEGMGGIDAMRREMIRLYDSNMELRAQMKRLQTCMENANVVQLTELENLWRTRCTELVAALRKEQCRSNEKDELIAALQNDLTVARRVMTTMLISNAPHKEDTKNANKSVTEPRSFREVQRFVTPSYQANAPLVQQAEKAISKVKLDHSNRVNNTRVLPEKQSTTQLSSRSYNTLKWIQSSRSQIPDSQENSINENRNKERDLSKYNPSHSTSHSSHTAKLKLQEEKKVAAAVAMKSAVLLSPSSSLVVPQTGMRTVAATATTAQNPESSSCRCSVPQTLADVSVSDAFTPPKVIAKSWYDENEVKEIVMSSRASRLRLA
ncbi:hypothetical protein LSM04_000035 [Trypanosoma melophagium]|uniref:uncharacterized protein n=1 Tax=Trypanosoma melophagium TaxID=715481 RepID=UPI00351A2604|nr:hypothetical protein LSM04_000035 [Trypanosoma melophagium]